MEPGLKRASGQSQPAQSTAWSRMVQNLLAPMNYYLENMMQGYVNNRRLAKKLINNLNMEDL